MKFFYNQAKYVLFTGLLFLLLSGCGLKKCPSSFTEIEDQTKWDIKILQDKKVQFHGICLYLASSQNRRLVILDASGIVLLRATMEDNKISYSGVMASNSRFTKLANIIFKALMNPCKGWCGMKSIKEGFLQIIDVVYEGCNMYNRSRSIVIKPRFTSYEIRLNQSLSSK